MPTAAQYQEYLQIIANPDGMDKLAKLEFLNPDGTVAFALDNSYKRGYGGYGEMSRAFLQDGNLNVSLQNGQRRKASITLANLDGAFDYQVNKLWFGRKLRLLMGVRLSDGTEFYLPQGVFYIDSPQLNWKPNSRQSNYSLTDKWAYLDGSLFGTLSASYEVERGDNIFDAMQAVLHQSIYTQKTTLNPLEMIDSTPPIFTDYYNNWLYQSENVTYLGNQVPDRILVEQGGTYADIITSLNKVIVGWVGYDSNGAFVVTPSQDDISDLTKPVLWQYDTNSKTFLGLTETSNIGDVYNEIIVYGESLTDGAPPYGRAVNDSPYSDTSIGRIGLKTYVESASGYYTNAQCQGLAEFYMKRMTVLQKSVTFDSSQMFHLQENNLITVQRTDKGGSPVERHLIQSFSLPISQNRQMSVKATSVTDYL